MGSSLPGGDFTCRIHRRQERQGGGFSLDEAAPEGLPGAHEGGPDASGCVTFFSAPAREWGFSAPARECFFSATARDRLH